MLHGVGLSRFPRCMLRLPSEAFFAPPPSIAHEAVRSRDTSGRDGIRLNLAKTYRPLSPPPPTPLYLSTRVRNYVPAALHFSIPPGAAHVPAGLVALACLGLLERG